jgi:hypothetical protein
MKVRFFFHGAGIQSGYEETIDISDFGYTDENWRGLSDDEKSTEALEWACNKGMEYGWEDIDEPDALAKATKTEEV